MLGKPGQRRRWFRALGTMPAMVVGSLFGGSPFVAQTSAQSTAWQAVGGANSGNWTDTTHWSGGVPGTSSVVTIGLDPGTPYSVNLNTTATVAQFTLNSANATFGFNPGVKLTVNGLTTLAAGSVTMSGSTWTTSGLNFSGLSSLVLTGGNTITSLGNVQQSGPLTLVGGGNLFLSAAQNNFTNSNTLLVNNAGGLQLEASSVNNNAAITAAAGVNLSFTGRGVWLGFAPSSFSNTSTITAGGGLSLDHWDSVSNSGTIAVNGGNLSYSLSSTLANSGTISIAAGRTFSVGQGSTLSNSGAGNVTGSGTLVLDQAKLIANGSFSPGIANWQIQNGTTVEGGGTVTNATSLLMNTPLPQNLVKTAFVNTGTVTIQGTANRFEQAVTNDTGGTMALTTGLPNVGMVAAGGLTNRGVLQFNATTTAFADLVVFGAGVVNESAGTINAATGNDTINLTGTNGNFFLTFNNQGTLNAATTLTVESAGQFLNGGTITITGRLAANSTGSWSNGGTINLVGTGALTVDAKSITNTGQISGAGGGMSFTGDGLWLGNAALSFTNGGTITTAGGLTLSHIDGLVNTGTININGGNLDFGVLSGTFGTSGVVSVTAGSTFFVRSGSILAPSGGGNVTGAGTLVLDQATLRASSPFTPGIAGWQIQNGTTVDGGGTVANATSLLMNTSLTQNLVKNAFINTGTVTIQGTANQFEQSVTNENGGTVVLTTGIPNVGFVAAGGLTNRGTLQFAATSTAFGDIVLFNAGMVNEAAGTINVSTGNDTINLTGTTGSFFLDFNNQGTLNAASTLTVKGAGQFLNSGTITVTGRLISDFSNTLVTSGTINLVGSGSLALDGKQMANSGRITSATGDLSITGEGLWVGKPASSFNNSGTITAGNGLTFNHIDGLVNTGTIAINGGNLDFGALSGTFATSGTVSVTAGSTFFVRQGSILAPSGSGNVTGSGTLVLQSSTLRAAGALTPGIAHWELQNGATIDGAGPVTNATSLLMNSTTTNNLVKTAFVNTGTVTVQGTFHEFQQSVTNDAGGTFRLTTGLPNVGFVADSGFTNRGVLQFAATSTAFADVVLADGAVVNEASGTIDVASGNSTINLTGTTSNLLTFNNQGALNTASTLTVKNAGQFLNSGTITVTGRLISDFSTTLVTSGTINLVGSGGLTVDGRSMANSGRITSSAGTMSFTGEGLWVGKPESSFGNSGTITVGNGLSFSHIDGLVNTGTINVNGGNLDFGTISGMFGNSGTVSVTGGSTFFVRSGSILAINGGGNVTGSGTLVMESSTLRAASAFSPGIANWQLLNGAAIDGGATVTNATSLVMNTPLPSNVIKNSFVNTGTVTIQGTANRFQQSVVNENGGLIRITIGIPNAGFVADVGFTNRGTLQFAPSAGAFADVLLTSGAFTNESTGVVDVQSGTGTLTGDLTNQGTINVNAAFSLPKSGGTHANSGTINVAAGKSASFDKFTTFSNSGTITATGGLSLNPSNFANVNFVNSGTFSAFSGLTSGVTTLTNSGVFTVSGGDFNLNNNGILNNTGTVVIGAGNTLQVNAGSKIISGAGGVIVGPVAGQGSVKVNQATVTVNSDLTVNLALFEMQNARVDGGAMLINAGVMQMIGVTSTAPNRISAGFKNTGAMTVRAGANYLDSTAINDASGRLTVRGNGTEFDAVLTLPSGMINRGILELTSDVSSNGATITSTTGVIVTETGGRLDVLAGAGGLRIISADLYNQGDFNINRSVNLTKSSATYTNAGNMNIASGVVFNPTGIAAFTNSGNITGTAAAAMFIQGVSSTTAVFTNSGTILAGGGMTLSTFTTATNSGTITLGGDSTIQSINRFIHTGTIAIASGRTFTASSSISIGAGGVIQGVTPGVGTFRVSGVNLTVAGELNPDVATWELNNVRVDGSGSLTNSRTFNVFGTFFSFPNRITVPVKNTVAMNIRGNENYFDSGTATVNESGATFILRATAAEGHATLNEAGGLTNRGLLQMTSDNGNNVTIAGNGTVVNESVGTLEVLNGSGGNRQIFSPINNQGQFNVFRSLTVGKDGAAHVNSGTITVTAGATVQFQSIGSFTNSGTISGTNAGLLTFYGNSTTTSTFNNSGTIIAGAGMSLATMTVATNSGLITFSGGDFTVSGMNRLVNTGTITINTGRMFSVSSLTLDNGAGAIIQGTSPGQGIFKVSGNGILKVADEFNPDVAQWEINNSRVQGTGSITNSKSLLIVGQFFSQQTRLTTAVKNTGTLTIRGPEVYFDSATTTLNDTGATLSIRGAATEGTGGLTAFNGLTNRGILELTTDSGAANGSLTVNNAPLVNEAGARFDVLAGAGGTRTVNASIDNRGDFNINRTLTMGKSSATYTNSGTMNLGPVTLTVQSFGSFANSGSITGTLAQLSLQGVSTATSTFSNSGTIYAGGGITLSTLTTGTNSGSITVSGGNFSIFSMNKLTNTGTIAIAAGRTFTVQSLTLSNVAGGTIRGINPGEGILQLTSASNLIVSDGFNPDVASWELNGTRLQGIGTATNSRVLTMVAQFSNAQTRLQLNFVNTGTITSRGGQVFVDGTLLNDTAGRITVSANSVDGNALLTLQQGMINRGIFELSSANGGNGTTVANNTGTIVNESGGQLNVLQAAGGFRTITSDIDNRGTFAINYGTTLNKSSATYTNSGTITVAAGIPWVINNFGRFENQNVVSGTSAGLITMTGVSSTTASFYNGGIFTAGGGLLLNNLVTVTNNGTITVSGGDFTIQNGVGTFVNNGTLQIASGRNIVVPFNTVIDNQAGAQIKGINPGEGVLKLQTLTVLKVADEFKPGTASWELSGARVLGTGSLANERPLVMTATNSAQQSRIGVPLVNRSSIDVRGDENYFDGATTNESAGTITVRGTAADGNTFLFASNLTNAGLLQLTSDAAGSGATLSLNSATLTNEASGTIDIVSGAGGGRTITAMRLTNQGVINVNRALAMNRVSGTYNNSGAINVASGVTLSVTSLSNFVNTGAITGTSAGLMTFSGVSSSTSTFLNTGGSILAGGGLSIGTVTSAYNSGSITVGGLLTIGSDFVNDTAGTVNLGAGSGTNSITGLLDNRGTMQIHRNLTVDKSGATHTNSGSITVDSGARLTITQTAVFGGVGSTLALAGGGLLTTTIGFVAPVAGQSAVVNINGSGSGWTNNANLYVGGNASAAGGSGAVNVSSGGRLDVLAVLEVWEGSTLNLAAGGTLTAGLFDIRGNVTLSGNTTITGWAISGGSLTGETSNLPTNIVDNGLLTFAQTTDGTHGGIISGTGAVRVGGTAVLTLTNNNTYTGRTTIFGGTLLVGTNVVSGTNGAVGNSTTDVVVGDVTGTTNATLYLTPAVSFGRLLTIDGNGTNSIGGNTTGTVDFIGGIRLWDSVRVSGVAGTVVNVGGTVTGTGGVTVVGGGTVNFNGANSYTGDTRVAQGTLVLGTAPGSTNYRVDVGATLDVRPLATLQVTGSIGGGGTVLGTVDVSAGGTASGSGSFETLNILAGGTVAPGNSPGTLNVGTQTWGGGGSYVWQMNDVDGGAGLDPGWDLINITGQLNITATAGSKFTIYLNSLLLDNSPGPVYDFDPSMNYSWTIATASGGVTGFDSSAFTLETTGFVVSNPGGFSLINSGNNIMLTYSSIPEPGSFALVAIAAGAGYWRRRRNRRVVRPATVRDG